MQFTAESIDALIAKLPISEWDRLQATWLKSAQLIIEQVDSDDAHGAFDIRKISNTRRPLFIFGLVVDNGWKRATKKIERLMAQLLREICRRTRVVGNLSDGNSALILVAARLRHIAGTKWSDRVYLDMTRLREADDRGPGA